MHKIDSLFPINVKMLNKKIIFVTYLQPIDSSSVTFYRFFIYIFIISILH